MHFRGRGTSPAPRTSQSTLGSRLQPLCLNQPEEVVVVVMGSIATATVIAERDGPCISSPNHGQPPEDAGDEQFVYYFLSPAGNVS